jgi:ABC-type antimicrobial peptide transport system permease subunit
MLGPVEFAAQARLVPHVDMALLAGAFPVLVLTAVLAGIPAANRAGRVDPAESLRSE